MSTTSDRRHIALPTSGVAYQGSKGQPHHPFFAQELAKNLNYALLNKTASMIATGHGAIVADNTFNTTDSNLTFDTLGPLAHIVIPWPHTIGMTVAWAVRAYAAAHPAAGTMTIYACDRPWTASLPPTNCLYDSLAVNVANQLFNDSTGTANGEYIGTLPVTFPLRKDSMLHLYVKLFDVGMAAYSFWVNVTP